MWPALAGTAGAIGLANELLHSAGRRGLHRTAAPGLASAHDAHPTA